MIGLKPTAGPLSPVPSPALIDSVVKTRGFDIVSIAGGLERAGCKR